MAGHSIKQQLRWARDSLSAISSSAQLDAEVLLAHCLGKDRSYLLTWPERPLSETELDCFHGLVRRRLQPQPVAYLLGQREFYSLELNTTPATLVPRPETELLVDSVLQKIEGLASPQVLELGTGTGAIAVAIKQHAPQCRVVATDMHTEALVVAQSNAQKHHVQIEFVESDWFQHLPQQCFDIIVSNPPYIAADDPYLRQGDLPAEPQSALCSGESGLEALQTIISGASHYLKAGGWIILEHGYAQAEAVAQLLSNAGFEQIELFRDFNDLPRMSIARKVE